MYRVLFLLGIFLFPRLVLSVPFANPALTITTQVGDENDEPAWVEPTYHGLVTDPWGFRVQLDEGLVGHHNSPQGVQGHGMWIPVEQEGDTILASIEFFAGYNAALESNPACKARGMTVVEKEKSVLQAGPISLGEFDGWRVSGVFTKAGREWLFEDCYFLRDSDKEALHFDPDLLKHSFDQGCDDGGSQPRFEYVLGMEAQKTLFPKTLKLFQRLLRTWKFVPIKDR